MKQALVLQHVPFEGPGAIGQWLQLRGYTTTLCRLYENAALPAPEHPDLVVIMGGPMSVNDEADCPFLSREKLFLREVLKAGIPVLGVCLGAQLLAQALGATVRKNPEREIGWFTVHPVSDHPLAQLFADTPQVLHWHGDTFTVPKGTTPLLASEACANQAFVLDRQVLALQFHLEIDSDGLAELCKACSGELVAGRWVQQTSALLAHEPDASLRSRLFNLLDVWLEEAPPMQRGSA